MPFYQVFCDLREPLGDKGSQVQILSARPGNPWSESKSLAGGSSVFRWGTNEGTNAGPPIPGRSGVRLHA